MELKAYSRNMKEITAKSVDAEYIDPRKFESYEERAIHVVDDSLLDLKLFPSQVAAKEIAFYQKKLNRFGLPLDSRKDYTKLDWEIWTATLAASSADFQTLVAPIDDWLNHTPSRVPLTDWYWTTDGKKAGFQARSVVGGVFIKMLSDAATWKKWSNRAK